MLDLQDDTDDDALPTDPNVVPTLPRQLQKKLFTTFGGYEHLLYPGGELYAQIDRTIGSDLVKIRNPTESTARISYHVGLNADFQVRAERVLIPAHLRPTERLMLHMLGNRMIPLRVGWMRTLLVLEPGATAEVPDHWLVGLRTVKDGVVVGGMFPRVEVVDEEDPPQLHAGLRTDDRPPPSPTARRRP